MKKIVFLLIIVFLVSLLSSSLAEARKIVDPTTKASPISNENRQTFVNNITDFFSTIGKPSSEAKKIKKRRRYQRRKARLEARWVKDKAATKRRMKKQQKNLEEKVDLINNQ